jgi:hypothetical protein
VQGDHPFAHEPIAFPGGAARRRPAPPGTVEAVAARWRCTQPGCGGAELGGAVLDWPAWAAHHTNARPGAAGRSVFSTSGEPLHPYMGPWANGCRVTAHAGIVLIVEWRRGADTWRETLLAPGESHVIKLVPPEDGALIETLDDAPGFSVRLERCSPLPIEDHPGRPTDQK